MAQRPVDSNLIDELRELEEFRRVYHRRHPAVELTSDDPDLRRLIESLAFFSMRTRTASIERQQGLWRRLFRSYFSFLLSPMPMMGTMEAQWLPRLSDPVELLRGTELRAKRSGGMPICFQTLSTLRVLPVSLAEVTKLELPLTGGTRIVLTFVSRFQRSDAPCVLSLHPDLAGGYAGALQIWYELRCNLRRAHVIYDGRVQRDNQGEECQVRFGAYASDLNEPRSEPDPTNQLAQARSFFHYPQQELYLNVGLPNPSRPWNCFHLIFDLGPDWPAEQKFDQRTLRPFTVPIANQRQASSTPLYVDGTREAFPLLYPQADRGFQLLSLRGVYRLGDGRVAPLLPLSLATAAAESGFELEEGAALPPAPPRLRLRDPRALLSPFTVAVDALWHQPDAERELGGSSAIDWTLPYRCIDGLDWQPVGPLRPYSPSCLGGDVEALLHLLALRMKPDLDLAGLLDVLQAVQSRDKGFYADFPSRIRSLTVRPVPDSGVQLSGIRHQYAVSFERYEPEEEPAVWAFLNKVHLILDSWNSDAIVDLTADVGGAPLRLPLGAAG
jgi:type VI secretion system protein ImpG